MVWVFRSLLYFPLQCPSVVPSSRTMIVASRERTQPHAARMDWGCRMVSDVQHALIWRPAQIPTIVDAGMNLFMEPFRTDGGREGKCVNNEVDYIATESNRG